MKHFTLISSIAVVLAGVSSWASAVRTDAAADIASEEAHEDEILTIDRFVPHVSTVPGFEGQDVELFVRERVRGEADDQRNSDGHHRQRPVVLMVHGSTQTAVTSFDLPFEDYSWMAFLAHAGFDVFAMDLTGYAASSHATVMDDACNTSRSDQLQFLIPNPLAQPCDPSYPFRLTTIGSDWDEIDTVVDYLRQLRGIDRIHLIGWSRGGPRLGGYAARHPEKVASVFLSGPGYDRNVPDDPPDVLPESGVPMTVAGIAEFTFEEEPHPMCEDIFDPAIVDVIKSTSRERDPLGSTWGVGGVLRAPVWNSRWGWNSTFAGRIEAPTLIMAGDLDMTSGVMQGRNLYDDLRVDNKVFVHVECARHAIVWENQHMILLRASAEWLQHGTFAGLTHGSFFVDTEGQVHIE